MVADYPMAKTGLTIRFWVIAGAALLGAFITLQLGFWQMNRAAEKQALQADIDARAAMPPLDTAALGGSQAPHAWMHRRVSLRGHWLDRHTVYLENRQINGKPGFYVVTPLQLDGAARVVLVQRGWVQRHFNDRTALPALPPAVGTVQVDGRIAPPPAKLYAFESREQGKIRQNLDLAGFAQETGLPLAAYSILQSGPQGDGLLRDWAAIQTGVAKHHGYAFQWFALSGLITVLFIWFQIVRRFFIIR